MKFAVNGYTVSEIIEIKKQDYTRGELRKEINRIDSMLSHIKRNKKIYLKLTYIVAIMIMSGFINPTVAFAVDVNEAVSKINTIGNQLLKLVRTIGYWVVLFITARDVIGAAACGNKKQIGEHVMKGLLVMATIYFLPELFSMMESIVSN